MSKKTHLDMVRIAKALGARREGKVAATAGYFGAMQLVAEVATRFKTPEGGGRGTDPRWTERRLIPLSQRTLGRLESLSARARGQDGLNIEPMQIAALLLEKMTDGLDIEETTELARPRRRKAPIARVRGNHRLRIS